jgi:hypothetical protein
MRPGDAPIVEAQDSIDDWRKVARHAHRTLVSPERTTGVAIVEEIHAERVIERAYRPLDDHQALRLVRPYDSHPVFTHERLDRATFWRAGRGSALELVVRARAMSVNRPMRQEVWQCPAASDVQRHLDDAMPGDAADCPGAGGLRT